MDHETDRLLRFASLARCILPWTASFSEQQTLSLPEGSTLTILYREYGKLRVLLLKCLHKLFVSLLHLLNGGGKSRLLNRREEVYVLLLQL